MCARFVHMSFNLQRVLESNGLLRLEMGSMAATASYNIPGRPDSPTKFLEQLDHVLTRGNSSQSN